MKKILWTLQHNMLPEQKEELEKQGKIYFLYEINPELFNQLSNTPPDVFKQRELAHELYDIAQQYDMVVLPIGSPSFMFIFAKICERFKHNFEVLFAHSVRVTEEKVNEETGEVIKVNKFKHEKFISIHNYD